MMTTLNRTQAPPFQLSSDFTLPEPEVTYLKSGAPLLAFRGLPQEVVRFELILTGGKWDETVSGASHFTSQLLPKGTRRKDAFQVAESFERLGAHCEVIPGMDFVTVTLYSLNKTFAEACKLLHELLHEPAFNEGELSLLKDIYLQNLRVNNEKSSFVASKEFRSAIFGSHHPYGSSIEEIQVAGINSTIIQEHYRNRFKIHAATLVGPLADAAVSELIEGLPVWKIPSESDRSHTITGRGSIRISMPSSIQSSIRIGKRSVTRTASIEYYEAVLANHILGGFFGSRLMKNIREKKGLTYGIYSSMMHLQHDSFWGIGAEVNQENTPLVLEEIRKEVQDLINRPVPLSELNAARNYYAGSWQSENSTLFAVADKVKSLYLAGLPQDFYQSLLTCIMEAGPGVIQQAAERTFTGQDLVEVIAG